MGPRWGNVESFAQDTGNRSYVGGTQLTTCLRGPRRGGHEGSYVYAYLINVRLCHVCGVTPRAFPLSVH